MSVLTALRLGTALLIVLALGALLAAGLAGAPAALLGAAALGAGWYRASARSLAAAVGTPGAADRPALSSGMRSSARMPAGSRLSAGMRRALLAVAVLLALLDAGWLAPTASEAVVRWLLAALAIRLVWRGLGPDTRDIVVVTFALLVTASGVSPGLGFMLLFAAYLVVMGWTLMLQHVLAEGAGPAAAAPRVTAQLCSLGALAAGSTVAVGLALFFVVPRVGPAALLRPAAARMSIGFTDSVELGALGRLETDPAVAMRVRFPDGVPGALWPRLRWRGVVLDRFDGTRWVASPGRRIPHGPAAPGIFELAPSGGGTRVRHEVTLEPLGTEVLFVPAGAVRIALESDVLVIDDAGALAAPEPPGRLTYVVDAEMAEAVLDRGGTLAARARARYLQLPPLPDRVPSLARRLVVGAADPAQAAARLTAFLAEGDFRYTLALERWTALDPLDEFLFVRRTGNCEYFAAALAVLLRSTGIPARVVNGFQAGEWNPYGGYLTVRLLDAHAWVEAYIDGRGWVTLDASPRAAVESAGPLRSVGLYLDAVRERWLRHIAEWGLPDQVAVVAWVGRLGAAAGSWGGARGVGLAALAAGGLGLGVAGLLRARRSRARLGRRRLPRIYRDALRALARAGHRPQGDETAREFAARVVALAPACATALGRLTAAYERERFGGQAAETATDLHAALGELRASLHASRAPAS